MIVNFPYECGEYVRSKYKTAKLRKVAHNHAVLSDFNVVANSRRFDNGVGADVDKVANFHRIVVECTTISLVRRSARAKSHCY
jgi:hypothetical protein